MYIGHSGYEATLLALYATILRHAGNDPEICQQLTGILDTLPAAQTETEYVDQVLRYYVLDFLQETKQFGTAPFWSSVAQQERMLETSPPLIALGGLASVFINWNKEVVRVNQQLENHNRFFKQIFGQYMSEALLCSIMRREKGLELGGEEVVAPGMANAQFLSL